MHSLNATNLCIDIAIKVSHEIVEQKALAEAKRTCIIPGGNSHCATASHTVYSVSTSQASVGKVELGLSCQETVNRKAIAVDQDG